MKYLLLHWGISILIKLFPADQVAAAINKYIFKKYLPFLSDETKKTERKVVDRIVEQVEMMRVPLDDDHIKADHVLEVLTNFAKRKSGNDYILSALRKKINESKK